MTTVRDLAKIYRGDFKGCEWLILMNLQYKITSYAFKPHNRFTRPII